MRTTTRLAVVLALAVVPLSACGLSGDGDPSPTPAAPGPTVPATTPETTASPTPSDVASTLPADLRTRPAVAAAIADAAERAKVTPDQVEIAAWSPVTFSNGALGCPKKGMSYTQAQVEGEVLLLRTDSTLFQYTAHTDGPFGYCADPSSDYTVGG
jgi:hypothetical protein